MKPLVLYVFLTVLCLPAAAQQNAETHALPAPPVPFDQPIRFNNLTLEDGLAQGTIYKIHQDRKGFMWFGHQDGISRYDGHTFKNYKHIPFDSTSASAGWVFDIEEDSAGVFWLAASLAGLSRFDPTTGTFQHFAHDPNDSTSITPGWVAATLIDRHGTLWVGTGGGLNRMDPDKPGRFERFEDNSDDPDGLGDVNIRSLFDDDAGTIWVGTNNGLYRMNPDAPGSFERLLAVAEDAVGNERRGAFINGMYQDGQGTLWVATQHGIVRLDPLSGDVRRIIPPVEAGILPVVAQITADPRDENVLWIGLLGGGGIARFNVETEEFVAFKHDPGDDKSLSHNEVGSIFTDRTGTIWAGPGASGITKFNPSAVGFSHLKPTSTRGGLQQTTAWGLHADSRGNLWLGGTGGALQFIDRRTGKVSIWQTDPDDRWKTTSPAGTAFGFAERPDGKVWIGTGSSLDLYDPRTNRFTHYRNDPDDSTSIPHNTVRSILMDSRGALWMGVHDGPRGALAQYDAVSKRFTTFRHVPGNEGSHRSEAVAFALLEDASGTLWVGLGPDGLSAMDLDNPGVFRHYVHDPADPSTITNGTVTHLVERRREPGILWICTSGGGLDRLDTRTGAIKHFTEYNSDLPNNSLYVALEDDEGRLWISTNRGITRFDPDTETFTNYGVEHGLESLEFMQWAGTRAPDGEMFFGSVSGINAFCPDEVAINALPPTVALTDLRLFNERVVVGPNSPLKASLDQTREITLDHDQARNVSFDFVALHYKNPELNRYAYRLDGFDPDWIDAGKQRSATYTNLPPGKYTFRVKAANSDGVWNEEGAALLVNVLPPWWRSMWAYLFYGLLFAGAAVAVDRVQRRRMRRKAMLEQAELRAQAAESEREAAEAQSVALQAENEKKKNAELLSEIGKELTSSLDLDTIFDRVYEHVNHLVDAPVFGIGLYNEEKQQIDYRLAIENGKRYAPYSRNTKDKNQFPVWCIEHREAVFVNDVESEYSRYIDSYEHLGGRLEDGAVSSDPQSLIYLPLLTKDRVLGVISIQSFRKNAYSEHDLNILRALATYSAIAVDNADAYRRLNLTLDNLREAQQQLVHQEKLASLGQLTAGIAHEIKNPLNFVTNFSVLNEELAAELDEVVRARRDQIPADLIDEVEDLITSLRVNSGHVAKHGKRADSIVKSMMEHASGGHGERFPVDVNAFVEEYVNLAYHGRRAQSPGVELFVERDFEDGVGTAEMAPQELGRVLVNLLNNAFDAVTERNGGNNGEFKPTVTVRTQRHGDRVHISVQDNGPGIPASVRERIFEPFFTTKPTGSGTGLGLSLSYDIVTQGHGGHLLVESEVGDGASFTIELPFKKKSSYDAVPS